jgi:hypothetical protein
MRGLFFGFQLNIGRAELAFCFVSRKRQVIAVGWFKRFEALKRLIRLAPRQPMK